MSRESKFETWQEAFVHEKIWPEVLDWYLFKFFAAFMPEERKPKGFVEPKVYNVLVVVGRPGVFTHNLHVPLLADHAKRIDVLFKNFNKPSAPAKRLTVREYFEGTELVVWDEKPYENGHAV